MTTFFDTLLAERIEDTVTDLTTDEAAAANDMVSTICTIVSNALTEVRFDNDYEDEVAEHLFGKVMAIAQPHIDTVLEALGYGEGEQDEEPEVEVDEQAEFVKSVDDSIEALFAALYGPEFAAQVRAEVEENDRIKAAERGVSVQESFQQDVTETLDSDDFADFMRVMGFAA